MGASKIMVIRHAEKPGTYKNAQYFGVNSTGTIAGKDGKKHLITTGWQRAGALVTLFAPPLGPKPGLATPAWLFASNPKSDGSDAGDADDSGPSQRPYETLTPLAAVLNDLSINADFKKSHYEKMVKQALSQEGAVLIAWQHEDIALKTKDGNPGISQVILDQTQTPAKNNFKIPKTWPTGPQGARYDLVFVFDRPTGTGPIVNFCLVAQMLLAGDAPAPV
jgi:hypothetical protein